MTKVRKVNQVIALIVVFAFVTTNTLIAAPPKPIDSLVTSTVSSNSIPNELGSIEEIGRGRPDKTIIYIQDAHDSLEAQESIAKTIDLLVGEHGVKTVLEEGYEGEVPTDGFFEDIRDRGIRQKVSHFLLDRLRIGAAEYAHINRDKDFKLIGADSIALHKENVAWYREAAKLKEETKEDLDELGSGVRKLIDKYFERELKAWLKDRTRFQKKESSLIDYLKRSRDVLLKKTSVQELELTFPNIYVVLETEKSKSQAAIEKIKTIDARNLFHELEALEKKIAGDYLKEERDQKIFQYHRAIELLRRLNEVEVTPAEYEEVKGCLEGLSTQELADFLAKYTQKTIVLSARWETNIQNATKFYELSKARDQEIAKRLDQFLKSKKEKIAVLVYGGFHRDPIKEMLIARNLSYLIVSPKITEVDRIHSDYYKRLMSVEHLPYELPTALARASRAISMFVEASGAKSARGEVKAYLKQLADYFSRIESLEPGVVRSGAPSARSELRTRQSLNPTNSRAEARSKDYWTESVTTREAIKRITRGALGMTVLGSVLGILKPKSSLATHVAGFTVRVERIAEGDRVVVQNQNQDVVLDMLYRTSKKLPSIVDKAEVYEKNGRAVLIVDLAGKKGIDVYRLGTTPDTTDLKPRHLKGIALDSVNRVELTQTTGVYIGEDGILTVTVLVNQRGVIHYGIDLDHPKMKIIAKEVESFKEITPSDKLPSQANPLPFFLSQPLNTLTYFTLKSPNSDTQVYDVTGTSAKVRAATSDEGIALVLDWATKDISHLSEFDVVLKGNHEALRIELVSKDQFGHETKWSVITEGVQQNEHTVFTIPTKEFVDHSVDLTRALFQGQLSVSKKGTEWETLVPALPSVPEGWTRTEGNSDYAYQFVSETRDYGIIYTTLQLINLENPNNLIAIQEVNSYPGRDYFTGRVAVTPSGSHILYSMATSIDGQNWVEIKGLREDSITVVLLKRASIEGIEFPENQILIHTGPYEPSGVVSGTHTVDLISGQVTFTPRSEVRTKVNEEASSKDTAHIAARESKVLSRIAQGLTGKRTESLHVGPKLFEEIRLAKRDRVLQFVAERSVMKRALRSLSAIGMFFFGLLIYQHYNRDVKAQDLTEGIPPRVGTLSPSTNTIDVIPGPLEVSIIGSRAIPSVGMIESWSGPNDAFVIPLDTSDQQGISGGFDFGGVSIPGKQGIPGNQNPLVPGGQTTVGIALKDGDSHLSYSLVVEDHEGDRVQYDLEGLSSDRQPYTVDHDTLMTYNLDNIAFVLVVAEDLDQEQHRGPGRATAALALRERPLETFDYASSVSSTLGLFATPQFVNLVSLGSQEQSTTTLDQETGIVTVTVNPTLVPGEFAGGGPYYREFAPHPPINPEEENLSFSLNYTGGSVLQIEVISQEVYAGERQTGVYRVFGVRPTGIGGVELPREAIEAQGVDLTNLRSLLAVARQE
ncbi:MAG: hypothetical protein HYS55_00445, partial [Candidatus Omnitrophica bacterium]|nr:hypothetical protein [Candidatus Omnitrophota bacterium]